MAGVGSGLSLTDWMVLALLAETPAHGFAVARELTPETELGQVWTVRRPLVYRALEHLVAAGMIEPTRTERGDQGPHRTVFRPTRSGRARVTRWLETPVDHPRDVRTDLLVKFTLLARRGASPEALARRQLALFAPMVEGLADAARTADGAGRVVARWRAESIEAITRTLRAVVSESDETPVGAGIAGRGGSRVVKSGADRGE